MASKLPQNIKEAMIRPIDKPSMGTSFSAEDIEEINPKKATTTKTTTTIK
jgi:hypothetical protein